MEIWTQIEQKAGFEAPNKCKICLKVWGVSYLTELS